MVSLTPLYVVNEQHLRRNGHEYVMCVPESNSQTLRTLLLQKQEVFDNTRL